MVGHRWRSHNCGVLGRETQKFICAQFWVHKEKVVQCLIFFINPKASYALHWFLASHWYVLDTLLGYMLRIAPIGLYARFWNQFTTINWLQHYFIILSWPWLPYQWTSQVNLLSILPLSWHNYPALFSLVSFLYSGYLFYHNRSTHYDEVEIFLVASTKLHGWVSLSWKLFWYTHNIFFALWTNGSII
jgi:hypothetical protein